MIKSKLIIIGVMGGLGSGKISVSCVIFNNFLDYFIMMFE